jgi:hypothetical protein
MPATHQVTSGFVYPDKPPEGVKPCCACKETKQPRDKWCVGMQASTSSHTQCCPLACAGARASSVKAYRSLAPSASLISAVIVESILKHIFLIASTFRMVLQRSLLGVHAPQSDSRFTPSHRCVPFLLSSGSIVEHGEANCAPLIEAHNVRVPAYMRARVRVSGGGDVCVCVCVGVCVCVCVCG